MALKFASDRLKGNDDIVLEAVQLSIEETRESRRRWYLQDESEGMALYYASGRLKADSRVVTAAIHRRGGAIRFASPQMTNDYDIVLAYFQYWRRKPDDFQHSHMRTLPECEVLKRVYNLIQASLSGKLDCQIIELKKETMVLSCGEDCVLVYCDYESNLWCQSFCSHSVSYYQNVLQLIQKKKNDVRERLVSISGAMEYIWWDHI